MSGGMALLGWALIAEKGREYGVDEFKRDLILAFHDGREGEGSHSYIAINDTSEFSDENRKEGDLTVEFHSIDGHSGSPLGHWEIDQEEEQYWNMFWDDHH
ncbi:hypothetical protein I302_105460 [Kwoniella bestiolae CBS 10118]|uniref:Uncharacterized protein n=1 Tax=Kwoniella bestiolae CBS 10118 TaxID=1296100 RepID=A0A1B9FT64_9TREE|nr:hypothetical protein I302_08742 [Kwoniella bestiolae CBS 10118]OCF21961.1 hypothetical protein I302_08742 [Kwoniella bestiolae CBS 10118]